MDRETGKMTEIYPSQISVFPVFVCLILLFCSSAVSSHYRDSTSDTFIGASTMIGGLGATGGPSTR